MQSGNLLRGRRELARLLLGAGLALLAGGTAPADDIADLYQKLQRDPQSLALNLQYGAAAEKAGKLKWALPAYERALAAAPGNSDALAGIARVRRRIRAEAAAIGH